MFINSLIAFDFKDISSNFHEPDEIHILKRLDIDKDFIYDKGYNDLKNDLKELDIIFFKKAISSNPQIFLTLKDMLQKSKVPDLFLYLAMVESKFLIDAKSHKKAAGLWQIVPKTAKILRLKVNRQIDERLDPIKSTKAALSYLQYLHDRFKKWYLVALAYNCGETKLASAIKKARSDDIFVLLDDSYNYIPKESKDYIRKLIVTKLLASSKPIQETINSAKNSSNTLGTIKIKKKRSIKNVANSYKISNQKLKKFNAHLLSSTIPSHTDIYLPLDIIAKRRESSKSTYITKKDTTLYGISKKFHLPLKILRELNPDLALIISKKTSVKLPMELSSKDQELHFKSISQEELSKEYETFTYKVLKGDTLFTISLRFNNKISAIKRLNPSLGYDLKEGEEILLLK